jgi:ribonuclease D
MIEVKLKGRSSMDQDNKLWEKRPLSEDILKYASSVTYVKDID